MFNITGVIKKKKLSVIALCRALEGFLLWLIYTMAERVTSKSFGLIQCICDKYNFSSTILLKICGKLSKSSNFLKNNGYLVVLLSTADHVICKIMVRINLNYGCLTIFYRNGRIVGQFSTDY